MKNNRIIAFTNFSEISKTTLAYNMIIMNFDYRNLCRKLIYEGAQIAHSLGYEFLNIQGSETEKQHKSKRRFKAEIEIAKKHMAYRSKER